MRARSVLVLGARQDGRGRPLYHTLNEGTIFAFAFRGQALFRAGRVSRPQPDPIALDQIFTVLGPDRPAHTVCGVSEPAARNHCRRRSMPHGMREGTPIWQLSFPDHAMPRGDADLGPRGRKTSAAMLTGIHAHPPGVPMCPWRLSLRAVLISALTSALGRTRSADLGNYVLGDLRFARA